MVLNQSKLSWIHTPYSLNYKRILLGPPEKIDNLPYNSDMHGQTSQPLGSFGKEKTQTQVNVRNIFSGEKMFF